MNDIAEVMKKPVIALEKKIDELPKQSFTVYRFYAKLFLPAGLPIGIFGRNAR